MANFSTEFPIDPKNTVEDVLHLACEWITGSPHTKIQESDLQEIPRDGERTISVNSEHVSIANGSTKDFEIGGLRYVRTEDGLQ